MRQKWSGRYTKISRMLLIVCSCKEPLNRLSRQSEDRLSVQTEGANIFKGCLFVTPSLRQHLLATCRQATLALIQEFAQLSTHRPLPVAVDRSHFEKDDTSITGCVKWNAVESTIPRWPTTELPQECMTQNSGRAVDVSREVLGELKGILTNCEPWWFMRYAWLGVNKPQW